MSVGSQKSILFVDYENVGKVDLNAIPADVHVPFFFGASQESVPTHFMRAALKLGPRFVPIDIEGQGTNALDFHIAFYLGEYLAANAQANCIILSRTRALIRSSSICAPAASQCVAPRLLLTPFLQRSRKRLRRNHFDQRLLRSPKCYHRLRRH